MNLKKSKKTVSGVKIYFVLKEKKFFSYKIILVCGGKKSCFFLPNSVNTYSDEKSVFGVFFFQDAFIKKLKLKMYFLSISVFKSL